MGRVRGLGLQVKGFGCVMPHAGSELGDGGWVQGARLRHTRCRANMAHVRQPRPDSGLGFQEKVLKPFRRFPLRSETVTDGAGTRKVLNAKKLHVRTLNGACLMCAEFAYYPVQ